MVRKILGWCDKKYEEILEDDDNICHAKAFGLGAIEGAIDALVVLGAIASVSVIIETIKGTK